MPAALNKISVKIKLDVLKGSVNAMMIPARNGRRLIYSGNYRAAKAKVTKYLEENYSHLKNILSDHPEFYYTKVVYIAYDNWLTKSSGYKKLRKKDVSNYTKNVEDVLFTFLGADDSSIVISHVEKGLSGPDESPTLQCDVELYEMDIASFRCLE